MKAMVRWCGLLAALACGLGPAWGVGEGERPPGFSLVSASGERVALRDYSGRVVAVAFWASWGRQSAEALQELEALVGQYGARGLSAVGVNQREEPAQVAAYARRHGLSFPMLLDDGSVARAWGVGGVPDLWVLNREGVVTARFVGYGPAAPEALREAVEAALAPPARPGIPAELRAYAHLQLGAAHLNIGDAFVRAGLTERGHYGAALREFQEGLALALEPGNVFAQEALRRLGAPWVTPEAPGVSATIGAEAGGGGQSGE